MLVKKVKNGTYIFEKKSGITAYFSQKEEELLYKYFDNNIKTDFIKRLYDLQILTEHKNISKDKEDIFLQSIHIDITDSCPLNCSQCYKNDSIDKFMDFNYFKSIIDEAEKLKIFQIAIGGGEPFVHKHIIEMIEYVSKTEMSVSITSSGYSLNENMIDNLIKAGLNHIQISLNGSTKEINQLSRDGYDYAIRALEILSNTQLSFGINVVVRKDNVDNIKDLINLAKKYKADNINLLRYKPTNFEDYKEYELDSNDIEKLLEVISKNRGFEIKVDSAFTPLLMLVTNARVSKNQCGCGALSKFINITTKGEYKPCSHLALQEKADSIYEYYTKSNNKTLLHNLDYIKDTQCKECKFSSYCYGCPAITHYKFKTFAKGEKDCKMFRRKENV